MQEACPKSPERGILLKLDLKKMFRPHREDHQYISGSSWSEGWRNFRRNPTAMISLFVLGIICLACVLAPLMVNLDSSSMDVSRAMSPPSRENPFGTDYIGRDLLSRVLYGGRNTLYIAFSATLMAAAVGSLIGIVSGYYGGNIDFYIMRLMDILSSVPSFLLAIIVEVALGWGEGNFRYALAIAAVPSFARLLRPSVMGIMSSQYIEASRALGAGTAGIIYRHVVHNIAAPLLIQFTSSVANTILTCTILGYLGIGISPPTPEWGSLVYYGTAYLRNAPHIALFPSMAVTLTVLSLNILGNGLRDALDPGNNG